MQQNLQHVPTRTQERAVTQTTFVPLYNVCNWQQMQAHAGIHLTDKMVPGLEHECAGLEFNLASDSQPTSLRTGVMCSRQPVHVISRTGVYTITLRTGVMCSRQPVHVISLRDAFCTDCSCLYKQHTGQSCSSPDGCRVTPRPAFPR